MNGSLQTCHRISFSCALFVALLGALTLIGWISGIEALANIRRNYIPMAPSTALAFAVLGTLITLRETKFFHRAVFDILLACVAIVAGAKAFEFFSGVSLGMDLLLVTDPAMFESVRKGRMSPITALNFLLICCAIFALARAHLRVWAGHAALLTMMISSVVVLGYLYGNPLLYGGHIVPVALPTALAFVLLGVSVITTIGPGEWPLQPLIGDSDRAVLLRWFLPAVVIVTLLDEFVRTRLVEWKVNPALSSALSTLLYTATVMVVISQVVRLLRGNSAGKITPAETVLLPGAGLFQLKLGEKWPVHIAEEELGSRIEFREDAVFARRYKLLHVLGKGGTSLVWKAHDQKLDRDVALKFVLIRTSSGTYLPPDGQSREALRRELARVIDLHHTHIVRVYDFIEENRAGTVYAAISMEYVPGHTLNEKRAQLPGRRFEVTEEFRDWVAQACEALHAAHTAERQVIHRDLKPGNLMVTDRGAIRLLDFGIASSLSHSQSVEFLEGTVSGTIPYMSPQQLRGEPLSVLDDVYGFAATLYTLLTGTPPFRCGNDNDAVSYQIFNAVPPSLLERRMELDKEHPLEAPLTCAAIPSTWERAIAAGLSKDGSGRPGSIAEFAKLLNVPGRWEERLLTTVHANAASSDSTSVTPRF